MRHIKMVGLAALAVGAFMAFVGVTPASAITELEEVVLCKTKVDPCPKEGHFLSGTVLHAELVKETHATLLGGIFGNILCKLSTVLGNTDSLLAHGLITEVTFGTPTHPCTHSGESCEVSMKNLPYLALVLLTSDHKNYHLVVSKHPEGAGPPKAQVVCPGVNCTFGAAEVLFEVLLDEVNNDVVLDVSQSLEREGGFCPSTSVWDAKYLIRCLEGGVLKSCWPKMEFGSKLV